MRRGKGQHEHQSRGTDRQTHSFSREKSRSVGWRLCHIHAGCSLQNKGVYGEGYGKAGALLDEPNAVRYE
jgi:hypothetical protein